MRSTPFTALLLAMVLALATAAVASPDVAGESIDGEPVPIGTFRKLRSEVLGEDRLLLVCLPTDYEESTLSYPVLFVLYADQIRGYFAESVHTVDRLSGEGSIPQMIIVGVANVDRYRDLSPVGRRGNPSGIEPFSRFVEEELIPFVDAEYRAKDYRVLIGPQAGSAFGLYTLGTRPGLFDAFILENPFRSAEAHEVLMPLAEGLAGEGLGSPTFLHIMSPDRAGYLDMTEQMGYLRHFEEAAAERDPPNLTLVVRHVDGGEDFIPPLLVKEGLRELFRGHRFPDDVVVKRLADITEHYAALSGRLGFEIDVPERVLATKGDELNGAGAVEAAMGVLGYLIEAYPTSVDGYWRLANLHREQGNREAALRYYRKCLEFIPNMPPALYWIEQLEVQE